MIVVCCVEIESLLLSCCELESRLERRRAEFDRMRDVHARYGEKMSQHRQLADSAETVLTSTLQTDQLHQRIQLLSAESQSVTLLIQTSS